MASVYAERGAALGVGSPLPPGWDPGPDSKSPLLSLTLLVCLSPCPHTVGRSPDLVWSPVARASNSVSCSEGVVQSSFVRGDGGRDSVCAVSPAPRALPGL